MDKRKILRAVLEALEEEVRRQLSAQQTAADGATHAEARAETKWDTCGLEQSYLARGHARQFEALAKQAEELRAFVPPDYTGKPIAAGALVETEMDGETFLFFLLHCGGGIELFVDGREITVITPESPVGAALTGKRQGDAYSFRAGAEGKIQRVE
jgi:transcription elongation GreA/GreB family factor